MFSEEMQELGFQKIKVPPPTEVPCAPVPPLLGFLHFLF